MHIREVTELDLPERFAKPVPIRPTRFDSCVACLAEPHHKHEHQSTTSPVIICSTCKKPTRHRFSHEIPKPNRQGIDHIWTCTVCEGTRIYGCLGG